MIMLARGELPTAGVQLHIAQWILRSKKSEPDWEIAELDGLTGAYLMALGRFEEAEPCLLESYESLVELRGSEVIYVQQALSRLIHLYEEWGKPERAEAVRAFGSVERFEESGPPGTGPGS